MNFDTRDPKAVLTLTYGCVEGLPCTLPAAELYNAQKKSVIHVTPNVAPNGDAVVIDVGSSILFVCTVLIMLLLLSTCYNFRLQMQLKRVDAMNGVVTTMMEVLVVMIEMR